MATVSDDCLQTARIETLLKFCSVAHVFQHTLLLEHVVFLTKAKKEKFLQHVGVTLRVDSRSPIVLLSRTRATNESSRVSTPHGHFHTWSST